MNLAFVLFLVKMMVPSKVTPTKRPLDFEYEYIGAA
jgi:hypothetical protein